MSPGVITLTPTGIIFCEVLLIHMMPNTASVMNYFIAVVNIFYGAKTVVTIILSIPRFIAGGKTGMVRLLSNLCSKILLIVWVTVLFPILVWVTISGLRVRSHSASLAVPVFDSKYLASFIVKLFTMSTTLSILSSFSLVNIVFVFYLFLSDIWMDVSTVTLLVSAIDSSSMNLRIITRYWLFFRDFTYCF